MKWDELDSAECRVRDRVRGDLSRFDQISGQLAEIAYHAPRLPIPARPTRAHANLTFQKNLVFLFLGRAIHQLRSLWLLTLNGYTTEAGALCASIIEHAAIVAEVARDPEKAKQLDERITAAHVNGQVDVKFLPWNYRALFDEIEKARGSGATVISTLYGYACTKKHPSTMDEAMNSRSGGELSVHPDGSAEDLSNKKLVLCMAHHMILIALEAISTHFEWDSKDPYFQRYVRETQSAQNAVGSELSKLLAERPPPTVSSTKPTG